MTNPDHPYREVLEDLAKSRGLSGAEELATKAHEVSPSYSVRGLLEAERAGYGMALDKVLGMSEEERTELRRAFVETYLRR